MKAVGFTILALLLLATASHAAFVTFALDNPNLSCPAGNLQKDANGWTIFCATTITSGSCSNSSGTANGTCVVYVDNISGNDSTCLAVASTAAIPSTPCKTLAGGQALMRNGHPDWMLLKRGDTFGPDGSGNNFGEWTLNGASATAPMIIGSYDPSQPGVVDPYVSGNRPVVENNMALNGNTPFTVAHANEGDYLAIVGIELYNYVADPTNGSYNAGAWQNLTGFSYSTATSDWFLMEDCKVSFYETNINFAPGNTTQSASAAIFNRNVIANAYANTSSITPSGMFTNFMGTYSFTENTFDANGYNAAVSGSVAATSNHNIYMGCFTPSQTNFYSIVTITNNIWSNDASNSQFRMAGTYNGNLFAFVPVGFSLGLTSDGACPTDQQDIYATAENNVTIDSNTPAGTNYGGGGDSTVGMVGPTYIENNIISTFASTNIIGTPSALVINYPPTPSDNILINNTILDWTDEACDASGVGCAAANGDAISPNNFNCTTCYSGGAYPDPYRNLGSYYATLSGATSSASVTGTINNCLPSCSGSSTAGNVMNVTAVGSGTLNVGDSITFPGQTHSVTITGNANIAPNMCGGSNCTGTGGTGTYAVDISLNGCSSGSSWSDCSTAAAVTTLASSQTLTGYSPQSLITLEHAQAKNNWNAALGSCAINNYIAYGFGIGPQACPPGG
jgi:hypothetical protein